MLSANGPYCNEDRVSVESEAGSLEAGGLCCNRNRVSDEAGAGRLEAGGRGVRAGRPAELDRVVAKALGSGCLGWENRMPDRAIVMCPRAVAGLCGWFSRIISAVREGGFLSGEPPFGDGLEIRKWLWL
jgi:hypothetical protein